MTYIKKILASAILAYIPCTAVISFVFGGEMLFFEMGFLFTWAILFMYSLPVVVGIFEIIISVIRIIETHCQTWIRDSVKVLVALSSLVLTCMSGEMIYWALFLTALLIAEEIVKFFINISKKRSYYSDYVKFVLVVSILIILLTAVISLICRSLLVGSNIMET